MCSRSVQATSLGYQHNERLIDISNLSGYTNKAKTETHTVFEFYTYNYCNEIEFSQ